MGVIHLWNISKLACWKPFPLTQKSLALPHVSEQSYNKVGQPFVIILAVAFFKSPNKHI